MAEPSQLMKSLDQSKSINNFLTNCQYTRDLGVALLQGADAPEHQEVLEESMAGIGEFIDLLKDKLKEKTKETEKKKTK